MLGWVLVASYVLTIPAALWWMGRVSFIDPRVWPENDIRDAWGFWFFFGLIWPAVLGCAFVLWLLVSVLGAGVTRCIIAGQRAAVGKALRAPPGDE